MARPWHRKWFGKVFTRGIHLIIIDGGLNGFDWPYNPEVRAAMGQTRSYAERMNLAVTAPQPDLSSTSYVWQIQAQNT